MITENQIKYLGFELVKEYNHDHFRTVRYKKSAMSFECTYDGEELVSSDLSIEKIDYTEINFEDLEDLNRILGGINQ